MPRKRDRSFLVRLAIIVAVGAALIAWADAYRRSKRPTPVPPDVQQEGLRLVRGLLARIAATDLGRSQRGRLLAETISDFVERDRLVFTRGITAQALYRREFGGHEVIYVKALGMGGRFVHQTPEGIAEGLFHEAVHARQSRYGGASIEEECDGYAAGLAAGAAATGAKLPDLLTLDGEPVARFVAKAYAGLGRRPDYRPVGESLEWLRERTGLE